MRCPTCDREFAADQTPAMPFCSERCRLIDLGRWLEEEQMIQQYPDPEEEEGVDDSFAQE